MGAIDGAAPDKGAIRTLLADRRFRLLWLSQFVSGLGDWLVIGFLLPLVTSLSGGSAFAVAGIWIAKIIPSLLFSGVIGALVDRFDRRRLMLACDIIRAGLALLLFTDNLAVIYVTVMLMETASLFFVPAKNALIPAIVAEEHVAAANGLSYTTQQASMLIGLTASGAILAGFEGVVRRVLESGVPFVSQLVGPFAPELLGPKAGIILDSLTFLLSATCILFIKCDCRRERSGERFSLSLIGREALESFVFLREHKELRGFIVSIGLAILGGGSLIALGPVYVAENLTGTVPFLDALPVLERLFATPMIFMMVFAAAGMVAGGVLAPRLERYLRLQTMFAGSIAAFGVAMLGFATTDAYWLASLFAGAAGFCIATLTVAGNTFVVRSTDDSIRGRVFTSMESLIRVSILLSMVVVAPLADIAGNAIQRFAERQGELTDVMFTGTRIALQLGSLIVLAAAVYSFVVLRKGAKGGAPGG